MLTGPKWWLLQFIGDLVKKSNLHWVKWRKFPLPNCSLSSNCKETPLIFLNPSICVERNWGGGKNVCVLFPLLTIFEVEERLCISVLHFGENMQRFWHSRSIGGIWKLTHSYIFIRIVPFIWEDLSSRFKYKVTVDLPLGIDPLAVQKSECRKVRYLLLRLEKKLF